MSWSQRLFFLFAAAVLLSAGYRVLSHFQSHDAVTALKQGHYESAVRFLEVGVEQGDVAAMTMLGNLYFLGIGVEAMPERAVKLYSRAAFAGSVDARVNMGHAYRRGLGVEEDYDVAYAWFNLAKVGGSQVAQTYMSELLAAHQTRGHKAHQITMDYATINNFKALH